MAENKNSKSQLAKTQKIPAFETKVFAPGTRDAEARKLVEDYQKVFLALRLVKRYNPVNPIIFILIKKRLSSLVQKEFELYKSFPEIVKKEKMRGSAGVVSSGLQQELASTSKLVSTKLNDLIREKMLKRRYMEEVYSFRLPPIRVPPKKRKSNNAFTSSSLKKKFY